MNMKVPSFSSGCVTALSTGCIGFFFGGWFLLGFGWLFGQSAYHNVREYYQSAAYPTTRGSVLFAERIDGPKHDTCHFRYSYTVAGKDYEGTRVGLEEQTCRHFNELPTATGATVEVYYAPEKPERAFVGRWFPQVSVITMVVILGMLPGVFITAYQMSTGQVRWK